MRTTERGNVQGGRLHGRPARLQRVVACDSRGAQLLHGCPVMTAGGADLGEVDHLMVDALTQQLRYVMLRDAEGGATIAIPWQSLYFDGALGRLVFYTFD
jgi:hypothetical protein